MNPLLASHPLVAVIPLPFTAKLLQRAISTLESSIPPLLVSLKDGDYSGEAPPLQGPETALVKVAVTHVAT